MKMWTVVLAVAACVGVGQAASAAEVKSGDAVVRAMYDQYKNDWYDTMKFQQASTTYNADGTTKVETWYEAGLLPGKLRIDIGPAADGNTGIMADGKAFSFKNGKLVASRPYLNLLLVLGFDVYKQAPEVTLAQLKQEGIDTTKFHEDTWQSEPVYVVGADKGDLKSKQFWVEKKSMLFVRIIEPDFRDPGKLGDIRFLKYRHLARGLIAERVEMHSDGRLSFSEDYSNVETDVHLDPSMFDPKVFEAEHGAK